MLGFSPVSSAPVSDTGDSNYLILLTGIGSAAAFGAPVVSVSILAAALASGAAFGTPTLGATIACTGIASAAAIGAPSIGVSILPVGIPGAEAFGSVLIYEITPAEPAWVITNQRRIDWILNDGTRIAGSVRLHTDAQVLPTAHHITDWVLVEKPNAAVGNVSYLKPMVLSVLIH